MPNSKNFNFWQGVRTLGRVSVLRAGCPNFGQGVRTLDRVSELIRGPAIKSGRSFMTAWAPLHIYRKYFVLTSETIPIISSRVYRPLQLTVGISRTQNSPNGENSHFAFRKMAPFCPFYFRDIFGISRDP